VGNGKNRKSMAYVENVAAFLEYAMGFEPGVHTYSFIDNPDFTMETREDRELFYSEQSGPSRRSAARRRENPNV